MQTKSLPMRRALRVALFVLLLSVAGMGKLCAQTRGVQNELGSLSVCEYTERIYVTENGAGAKNGDSWENAMDSLQLAVTIANENYNTYGNRTDVWVAEGTYYGDSIASNNAFTMLAGVNVYGGFAGTETSIEERDIDVHPTILDGQNVQRVLCQNSDFTESTAAVWDGFVIENGKVNSGNGGGAYIQKFGTLKRCIIQNNIVVYYYGGGTYLVNGGILDECKVLNNTVTYSNGYGGGVYINGNSSNYSTVINCLIENNSSYGGFGIYGYKCRLINNIIANNYSTSNYGYGAVWIGSDSFVINCHVVNNASPDGNAGVYSNTNNASSVSITNSVIWGNKSGNTASNVSGSLVMNYSAIEGGHSGTGNVFLSGQNEGGIWSPKFIAPTEGAGSEFSGGNWNLQEGSILINKGNNEANNLPDYDIVGNDRIQHGRVDIGAYESSYGISISPDANNIIYVTQTGGGTHDGSSWSNAVNDINLALSAATAINPKPTIWVAEGTYVGDSVATNNAFIMQEGVNVYGGFAGTETSIEERIISAHPTILDGQHVQRVLGAMNGFSANNAIFWNGFIVENGKLLINSTSSNCYGAGAYLRNGQNLKNCIIRNNSIGANNYSNSNRYLYGSGVCISDALLENCEIYGNTINWNSYYDYARGGGVYANNATLTNLNIHDNNVPGDDNGRCCGGGVYAYSNTTITNCNIHNNSVGSLNSYGYSGGLHIGSTGVSVVNCRIEQNQSQSYGGVYAVAGSTMMGCLVANNSAQYYGGLYCSGVSIFNCTFTDNLTVYGNEDVYSFANSVMTNSIVWGNKKNDGTSLSLSGSWTATYNAIEGGYAGTGNISLSNQNVGDLMSPRFTNPAVGVGVNYSGDWSLDEDSPCINSGTLLGLPENFPDNDIAGNVRVQQGKIDIGAYESPYTKTEITPDANNIIYVTVTGAGTQDGSSWQNAVSSISLAVTAAGIHTPVSTVWVAEGTYIGDGIANHNAFVIQEGVNVYGGFEGTETSLEERNFEQHSTILDGQNVQRVLGQLTAFTDSTTAVWDGFIIENGREMSEHNGGGVYIRRFGTLRNCIIRNNTAYNGNGLGSSANGGGVYMNYGMLENCEIYGNNVNAAAGKNGGGVYSEYGTLIDCDIHDNTGNSGVGIYAKYSTIDGCSIRNHTGIYEGGGIYSSGSSSCYTTITNCIIEGNKGKTGGGVYSSGYTRLVNCLIANNYATSTEYNNGGGGLCASGSGNNSVINCHIVNNGMSSGGYGAGVWSSNLSITNSVIWGNKSGNSESNIYNFTGTSITYSAIEGGWSGTGNITISSQNNGDAMSPMFTAPTEGAGNNYSNGDWTLQDGSVLINKGNNNASYLPEYDLAGNERIQQDRVDIGAYESPYLSPQLPNYENNVIYVKRDGTGDGTSWENAMGSLQNAVQTAYFIENQNPAPQVWVAEGTYYGDGIASHTAFYMMENVNVYGGFTGTEISLDERDAHSHLTILDGQQTQRVLLQQSNFTDSTSVIWDGFVMENGQLNSGYGAGAYIKKYGTLKNCIIRNNTISNSSGNNYGGGVYVSYGTLEDCEIFGNQNTGSYGKGGGIYSSYGVISKCKVYDNIGKLGGGVYAEGASGNHVMIKDSYFENNTSSSNGGGIYSNYSTLINVVIANNQTTNADGGGLYARNSIVTNCDIANNAINTTNTSYSGAGIYGSSNTLKNNIVWHNLRGSVSNNVSSNVGNVTYCAIEGGYTGTGNVALASENTGDYTVDNYVCFVNPENEDYHLLPYSACINAGSNAANTQEFDLDGNPRIWNDTIDIGAYEFREIIHFVDTSAVACDSLFWHDQHYSSSGIYVDTLTNQYGFDSIIALHLTINPSYYLDLYETACDSFYWGDTLYTETGDYIKGYQTIYECDSVVTLHLTINPTRPLGNFTYLIPANDYICRYADINFAWDTVHNANTYDLYFWQGDGGRPVAPTVTGLTSSIYHYNGLQNNTTYHWCVVAKNECVETESSERTFTCQMSPMMSVIPQGIVDFGEIELEQSRTRTIAVSATALPENISYSFLDNAFGQDSELFNITPSTNWNSANGGSLQVTFTPDATHLYYNTALRIVSGTLADTIYLTGSLANRFVFSTNVEESVYTANDEITITGHVEDILGNAVSNLDVDVYLIVMGSRITLPTVSDANGDYSVVYSPRYSEAGYYKVGSCEKGKYANAEHDAFDIPGMGRVSGDFIIWEVPQNNTLTGIISVRNRSRIPLGNIQVTPISLPDGCTVDFTGTSLGSLETGELQYSVSGTELSIGSDYEVATFLISSDLGITMNLTCYYYCYRGRGELDVYPYSIATTMTRNRQKMLSFQITNNGVGETGPITIDLPNVEWMSVMGGNTIESVPVGDSCAFTIKLAPDDNVNLNQYTGTIAVNCGNGNGISIPYQLEATSDSTGTLVVDVTDDYTFNTNNGNGPHLAGANVTLTGYYSLQTVAQGVTDENGHFTVENLPEGYYCLNVQARSHKEYNRGIIYIEAGKTHWKEIYLQFQAISYSWVVTPTEIPDVYEYELVCEFKTNVPIPVVTVECPNKIDTLAYGDSLCFNVSVTNHGLINAYEVQLLMPTEFEEYDFYLLFDVIDTLCAKTTIDIPCIVTRNQKERIHSMDHCRIGKIGETYLWLCNDKTLRYEKHSASIFGFDVENCGDSFTHEPTPDPPTPTPPSPDPPVPNPPTPSPGPWPGPVPPKPFPEIFKIKIPGTYIKEVSTTSDEDCTPCWKVAASTALHLTAYKVKPVGALVKFADCVIYDWSSSDLENLRQLKSLLKNFVNNPANVTNINQFLNSHFDMNTELLQCLKNEIIGKILDGGDAGEGTIAEAFNITDEIMSLGDRIRQCIRFTDPYRDASDLEISIEQLEQTANYSQTFLNELTNLFQEEEWEQEDNLMEFYSNFSSIVDTTTRMVSPQATQQLIATSEMSYVSDSIIQRFVDRWNRSVQYWNDGIFTYTDLPEGYDSNFIPLDTLMFSPAIEALETVEAYGYNGIQDMFASSITTIVDVAQEHTNDVCSKVSISFKQTTTMTREAFDGTLKIYNGHATDAMKNIDVDIVIKDADGVDKTDLFQINVVSLDQISGIDGSGILGAQNEGIIQFQMIPTIAAAPDSAVIYSFGGSFTFLDPFSGETMTYQLYPVELTVNPSPNLHVDYFVQRNIISDDPLTDTIETAEPAEIAMMIRNVGAGDANNVYLESSQPTIVDNENGLLVQFDMIGAAMNGEQRPLSLTDIPFGTIRSHTAGIAEWYFTSSLMGRIIHSTPHVIHTSSYGNPDLSLVTELNSHELIKAIRAYSSLDDGINDFFVNETVDFNHTPDKIYFSHGGTAGVKKVLVANTEGVVSNENSTVLLNVNPIAVGWNYACVDDPGQGLYEIISCTRDDGQEIPLNNVWVTHVTMFDDDAPIHENKLHIVDTLAVQQTTTYTLVFTKKPSSLRIFNGNEDEYWSNAANWEGYILPQADDEVLIDGICQLDEDAEVFSLTVAENQSLTIPDGRILTVSGSLTNADALGLVIEEGGQLMHSNAGAQGTVQKNIMPFTAGTRDGWYLVASPLVGNTAVTSVADMLYNNYDLYLYDESTHYWINQKDASNHFEELTNGKSYLYANNEEVMLGFEGELQSGSATITVLLNYTDDIDLAGFNLVGNPYAHNVTSYASVNVANGCYQINETKDDFIVNEISEANPLKPAEGFFVKATGEGASVTFNPGRGETANHNGSIYVELLYDGKLIDRLIVKSEGNPLRKFSLNNGRAKVFAMLDHREVAIVPYEGNEQPVNFKAAKDGTYTINVNVGNMEFDYLHLIDNLTGADVDLLALRQAQGPMSYTFEAKTTDYDSRFKLVFSVSGDENDEDAPFAFINNGNIIIVGAEADATLQIVDVLGHVIHSGDAMNRVSTNGMPPGVYVLRLINGENVKTQKIVVD